MKRIINPTKELHKKIRELEQSLHKNINDDMREKILKEIEKTKKELRENIENLKL